MRVAGLRWLAVLLFSQAVVPVQAALPVAEYRFDDVTWCTPVTALDSLGAHHGTLVGSVGWQDSPAAGIKPIHGAAAGFSGHRSGLWPDVVRLGTGRHLPQP